jgi:hypothetical protein
VRRFLDRAQRTLRMSLVPQGRADNPPMSQEDMRRLAVYQVVAARRDSYEALLWQVPALSLTAQAFLLTIALGGGTSLPARRLASLLSFISALASMQLLSKHRHFEKVDSKLCEKLERDLDLGITCGYLPHASTSNRRGPSEPELSGWAAFSSFKLWRLLLGLFALATLVTFALTFTGGLK